MLFAMESVEHWGAHRHIEILKLISTQFYLIEHELFGQGCSPGEICKRGVTPQPQYTPTTPVQNDIWYQKWWFLYALINVQTFMNNSNLLVLSIHDFHSLYSVQLHIFILLLYFVHRYHCFFKQFYTEIDFTL